MADLFTEPLPAPAVPPATSKIVKTYSYTDEQGQELFQVCRFEPKAFRPRHQNGNGEWVWNMDGVRRALYHLPDVLASDTLWVVEGEKDADNLIGWGMIATTSPGGANNWRPEFAECLRGKTVICIPDKDAPGYNYSKEVLRSVQGKAKATSVVILPGPSKDVSDWLQAGGDAAQLPTMTQDIAVLFEPDRPKYETVNEAVVWNKTVASRTMQFKAERLTEERTGPHARITVACDYQPLSWSYFNIERAEDRTRIANASHKSLKGDITKQYEGDDLRHDLDAFCAGLWEYHASQFVPEEMRGDETPLPLTFLLRPYILQGGGTILFAPPGRGKSYSALLWGISVDAGCSLFWPVAQRKVLFLNLERSRESLKRRVGSVNKVLGLPPTRPLLTLNARGKTLNEVISACRRAIRDQHVELVILDSISRAGLGDLNENQPVNRIIDALSSLCSSWLALGHTSRANDDHLFGSIMADAGADVVVQLSSEIADDGTLGVAWAITKQNDISRGQPQTWALTFNELGLTGMRKPKSYEFPSLEAKRPTDILTTVIEYICNQESGDATATAIATEFGFDRAHVTRLFTQSGRFIVTRHVKQSTYYGVKDKVNGLL